MKSATVPAEPATSALLLDGGGHGNLLRREEGRQPRDAA